MGLFTKKIPITTVFAGKCRANPEFSDDQAKTLIRKLLPEIMERELGPKAAKNPVYLISFNEWSSKGWYSRDLVQDIKENGFSAFNLEGDRKRMLDDIDRALVQRFDCTSGSFHPACFLFPSGDPLNGVFLLFFEQKVKEDLLK